MSEPKPIIIEGYIKIGEYEIYNKAAYNQAWIYHESGEGMGLSDASKEKLLKAIDDFYKENF